ncbi:MAG TPA: hypothetical protein VLI90_01635 [Tepidisphaeraceae bacterium]|nr:hypothetical protein [Tepidisphaeraceae bacterium]
MRFRPGHLALLIFQAIWLNVILPGHTRGVVTTPGTECSACESSSAPQRTTTCCGSSSDSKRQQTPNRRAQHCAICAFAARLTLPPVIDLTPAPLGFLERLALAPPARVESVRSLPTYDGRAPPAFA